MPYGLPLWIVLALGTDERIHLLWHLDLMTRKPVCTASAIRHSLALLRLRIRFRCVSLRIGHWMLYLMNVENGDNEGDHAK
jgi:hypothetical protein